MMEFEDHHEAEEDEELDEEDDDETLPPTNYDSSLPNSSSRPFKMPIPGASEPRSRSSSPPPLPLSLSFPAGKKPPTPARYRECLKNHAVGIGGHAVDGCGEFLPAGPDGSLDALKCAACNCHRNFHRKEVDPTNNHHQILQPHHPIQAAYFPHPTHPNPHPLFQFYPYGNRASPQQRQLALPSPASGGEVDEAEMISDPMSAMGLGGGSSSGKKRFRTKFTAEQKEKMMELAEKLGWRLQKQDEGAIMAFCEETGIKRHVLKVWMHNNKHTLGKGTPNPNPNPTPTPNPSTCLN